ncbi:MAG TPA: hypothetical protein VEK15_30735 [Vicinamibacteria bacterium]|nr:hypothetical protein [Vicinamibacteria bacterium]
MKLGVSLLMVSLLAAPALAQKFYPDDPLEKVPELWPTPDPQRRALSSILEFFSNAFGTPGEGHPERGVIPAGGVSTLGEVMDSPWYENRHARRRMTEEELRRGPGEDRPPATLGPWRVLTVKKYGFRPGILIADATDQMYLLRFDPPDWPELATGADVVSSKIFHALGYHVPESYIVRVERDRLAIEEGAERVTSIGGTQDLQEIDIDDFLGDVAGDPGRGYRAVATRVPGSWGSLLGPYQVFGTRHDDPNDTVPHEHRRDLRGLFVFSAWLNHTKMQAVNTLDVLVSENGAPIVRHYLVDFVSTLGSGGREGKQAWDGNQKLLDLSQTLENVAGMGVYTPAWMRANYGSYRSVGRFGYEAFDPERWKPDSVTAPFANRLPDDTFWAAKQLAAFTDDDIRTLVSTGRYSNPEAEAWIVRCLIERRDRLLATYFAKVLPIVDFGVRDDELHFTDLAVERGFSGPRNYSFQWSLFDNQQERHELIGAAAPTPAIPPAASSADEGSYFAVRVSAGEPGKVTVAYFRMQTGRLELVGLEYDWPGKLIADPSLDVDTGVSRYTDLEDVQKELFEGYAEAYNERTGFGLSPQEYFDSLTISERTTYDAVTHALMSSALTDESGSSLGRAIDLVTGVERIAGQYYGRSGDEQFRLYVYLKEGARHVLEQSQQFELGHLNTVYHVGYPYSYRQSGGLPSIQFSMSEEGDKADIDVDYRSSKFPQAMFNGHLTSSNSDVRAGDNPERHAARWSGFVAWWQDVFGRLPFGEKEEAGPDLLSREPPEIPTPLPPNRPYGEEPSELHDAAQEFLTDWLVRRDIDESAQFISPRILACVNTDDDNDLEMHREREAAAVLRDGMRQINVELGVVRNLTEAIDVVLPWRESIRVQAQPFERDFATLELTNGDASPYLCGETVATGDPQMYGTYFATLFRLKVRGGGALGLLWMKENGHWRIVAYEVFEQ